MTFSPLQIGVTFLSFLTVFLLAVFWHRKDKKSEKRLSDTESFPVLMSVFFWSAFLALMLKMLLDLCLIYHPSLVQTEWFFVSTIFAEDLVKVIALLVGLNIAGKRFNEMSDGLMYSVFAALGFIFFENILYLLSASPNIYDFLMILLGRNIFSFAAHLSVVIFGLFYAAAYLHTSSGLLNKLKKRKESRLKPYQIGRMLKFLWEKYSVFIILWIPFSPLVLLYQLINNKKAHITMSEVLVGGFLMSVYVHVLYDYALELNIAWLNTLVLSVVGIIGVILFHYFPKLDVR
ncbi:PrsW family intramembrane metalloprotease [Candidatus Peregrinibacteria bacterium]|jgi:RsiW-degrading membrane proteinase PrsW (M82 family)|nr:PrsW family intramembrane metalloprotease [Candidatus Peregrinibacteria bacterium]